MSDIESRQRHNVTGEQNVPNMVLSLAMQWM